MIRQRFAGSFVVPILIGLLATGTLGRAQGGDGTAVSQFRRTVTDSERGPYGTVRLSKKNGKQTIQVNIRNLFEDSFAIFITTNNSATLNTNDLVFSTALLDRSSAKKGDWSRKLEGNGAAPIEIPIFTDLTELAGKQMHIARPGEDLEVGLTNLTECVTNIVGVTTNVNCTTNIIVGLPFFDPGTTQTVFSVLWAPLPDITNPGAKFKSSVDLDFPEGPHASPDGAATLDVSTNPKKGQTRFDLKGKGLVRGQVYTLWIGDSPTPLVLQKVGELDSTGDGKSVSFSRDTKFGDPLPNQAGDLAPLSGLPIFILDEFENVHLFGIVPGAD